MPKSSVLTRREILAATAATAFSSGAAWAQDAARPNIVYIMADDLGYADLSCYGRREYKTPNIDSIATGGVRFLQAYANSAVCSATRAALITTSTGCAWDSRSRWRTKASTACLLSIRRYRRY